MKRQAETSLKIYDFESNPLSAIKVSRVDMGLPIGTLPMYEREDLFPASATAVNKGLYDAYKPRFSDIDSIMKVDEAALRYNWASAAYAGARHVRTSDLPAFRMEPKKMSISSKIDENHFLNIANEARHGRHGINYVSRNAFDKQKVKTTGASNNMRASGFERDNNPKIYPRLPTAMPMSVDPMRPTSEGVRINGNIVQPIAVFPTIGF